MPLPKLISNVILICALVCVWAGFRALQQFAVLLVCFYTLLCYWGLVRGGEEWKERTGNRGSDSTASE